MTTPVSSNGDAFPLLSTNPLVGRNNARDVRKYWFQNLIFGPGASAYTRRGVIHHGWQVGGVPQELMVLEDGPGPNVKVNAGLFVNHRGADGLSVDEGPYFGGWLGQTTIAVNMPAASGAGSRYDAVFAKIMDKNIAADAAGSEHGPYLDVRSGVVGSLNINGTPGTAGAPPSTPDGWFLLAVVTRATNDNVISQAEILDFRRGATVNGFRVMFPYDVANIATDTGYMLGEERYRPANSPSPYPAMLDRWDGTTWRGTRGHQFAQPAQTTANTLAAGTNSDVATGGVVIPWPGFPYKIKAVGMLERSYAFASGNSRELLHEFTLDDATFRNTSGSGTIASPSVITGSTGTILGFVRDASPSGGKGTGIIITEDSPTISDGLSHTVRYLIRNNDDTSTVTLVRGEPYKFQVEITPA